MYLFKETCQSPHSTCKSQAAPIVGVLSLWVLGMFVVSAVFMSSQVPHCHFKHCPMSSPVHLSQLHGEGGLEASREHFKNTFPQKHPPCGSVFEMAFPGSLLLSVLPSAETMLYQWDQELLLSQELPWEIRQ